MPRHRIQKSLARPVWLPMSGEWYRKTTDTHTEKVIYPQPWKWLLKRAGGLRDCPRSLAVDTDRWYNRSPEQMVLGFKNVSTQFLAELGHVIRRPEGWDPFIEEGPSQGQRKADKYFQHTRTWRYNLSNKTHAHAFRNLLHYSTSYAAGAADCATFGDLYRLGVGNSRELARWPMDGLHHYDRTHKKNRPVTEGHEVLEVRCLPAERPSKPKILRQPRPIESAGKRRREFLGHVDSLQKQIDDARTRRDIAHKLYQRYVCHMKRAGPGGMKPKTVERLVARMRQQPHAMLKQYCAIGRHPTNALFTDAVRDIDKAIADYDRIQRDPENAHNVDGLEAHGINMEDHLSPLAKTILALRGELKAVKPQFQEAVKRHKYLVRDQQEWDRANDEWRRRMKAVQGLTRLELRVRRVGLDSRGHEVEAFYLNHVSDLDIPLPAARRLGERFPAFWEKVYTQLDAEGNQGFNSGDGTRVYKSHLLCGKWRDARKVQKDNKAGDTPALEGRLSEYRQLRYAPEIVRHYLQPWKVQEACEVTPEHGLFLVQWAEDVDRDSEDYLLRLALWDADLLRWSPEWSVDEVTALTDLTHARSDELTRIAQLFVVMCVVRLRCRAVQLTPQAFSVDSTLHALRRLATRFTRGPPH